MNAIKPSPAILRPPYDLSKAPPGIRRLPLSSKGYPVPWFVDRKAPKRGDDYDFRIMDGDKHKLAIRERRCWVCGLPMVKKIGVFVAGPMCGINRTSSEPPCHEDCARWSVRACPFLAVPKRIRDDAELPPHVIQAGIGIRRNPGVAMLWASYKYTTWKPQGGGVLFDIGEPESVEWFAEGREATLAEVTASVESGLPILLKEAAKGGPEHCVELGRCIERFVKFLPERGTP